MYSAEYYFDRDYDDFIKNELANHGYSIANNLSSDEIRTEYLNLLKRLLPEKHRKVFVSKELICPTELQSGFENLKRKIENGENLKPYLSKLIDDLNFNDPLLNEWGIYHFHLGINPDNKNPVFIERTGPVLATRIVDDTVYFIDIINHGKWAKQEMVRIIYRNWPDSISKYRFEGDFSYSPTDDDVNILRKNGINSLVEVEKGIFYGLIGGGITSVNTSAEVTLKLIRIKKKLKSYEKYVTENLHELGNFLSEKSGRKLTKLIFKLRFEDNKFLLFEQNSNIQIELIIKNGIFYA